jgi:phosphatidate cytidylyltransferase
MNQTLKKRLLSGTLMVAILTALLILDAWLDGSLLAHQAVKNVQATIFAIIIAIVTIPATFEFAQLAKAKNLNIYKPVTAAAVITIATAPWWAQFMTITNNLLPLLIPAVLLWALFICQFIKFKNEGTMQNCGVNLLAVTYLGTMTAFILAIRIDFGLGALMMFIFVVKACDIGAYAIGSKFGKHKFAPAISPNKSWQGLFGGIAASVIVAVAFVKCCNLIHISMLSAVIFGVTFAIVGQLSDLAESMIKRDAQTKDSAANIPGFGGILDVIDSPLMAAVFAYIFFAVIL